MTTQLLLHLEHSGEALTTPEITELLNNLDYALRTQAGADQLMPLGCTLEDFTFTEVPALYQYDFGLPISATAVDQFIRLLGHEPEYLEDDNESGEITILVQGTAVGVAFEPLRAYVIYGGQADFERHPTTSLQVLLRTLVRALTHGRFEHPEMNNALAWWWLDLLVRSRAAPMPQSLLPLALVWRSSPQHQDRTPRSDP